MSRLPVAALALLAGAQLACTPKPLEILGTVHDFELTAQTGRAVRLADLRGRVWVADTIFTTCTGPCPMMSARMRTLAREVGTLPDVRFVSLTVDPEHDTPAALSAYASRFQAKPDRWIFLTGTQPALDEVCKGSLALSSVNGDLSHSTRFALIDREARIRGYYLSTSADAMQRLVADIKALAAQTSPI
ncbi:MAG TPA: SCO family protein [Bryobacteraceae bacterium]|nr:SCO family protein [Bryobacteraceae bacterium]